MGDYIHTSCPKCSKAHVDEGEWAEKAHRTHRCVQDARGPGCGFEWRLDWPAIGVAQKRVDVPIRMFAEDREGTYFHQNSSRRFVRMCGATDDEIVEVLVAECEDGAYYGWLNAGETVPCMIWPSKVQRDMCFTYGPEEERGKGRRVRLSCVLAPKGSS